MRGVSRRLRSILLALTLICVTLPATPSWAAPDIAERLGAIPGMTVEERTSGLPGTRWFWLTYRQPADHLNPKGTQFEQRIMLQHRSEDRPMVLFTTGYHTPDYMFRSEPTRMIDGNQISVEYRFFDPSRPEPANWKKDTIWQAATDEHRIIKALKPIYGKKWISTGGSKGGMTAVYHRRFYPNDVDASVVYVAPNDVVNVEDSRYDKFLATVGTDSSCRDRLRGLQRKFLERRTVMLEKIQAEADTSGHTFELVGGVDKSLENSVMDFEWVFWQYNPEADCLTELPDPATASDDALFNALDYVVGALGYTDRALEPYVPYYYQAGTELGYPSPKFKHLRPLLRYESSYVPRTYVPDEIPMKFNPFAMLDIDTWVRYHGSRLMFLYGGNDPWGAEPFRLGPGTKDSSVYVSPGQWHHGSIISTLPDAQREKATADLLRWADTEPAPTLKSAEVIVDPLTKERPRL